MLELTNVTKDYHNFNLNCSMNVKDGEIVGLVGANGAGKSTTFKAILRLINIDSGKIKIFDSEDLTINMKKRIGTILGDSTFQNFFTIKNAAKMMTYSYDKFNEIKFLEECKSYHLPLDKSLKSFSTGMLAKFKLLVSMSYDADLLILDEPTSGLDTVARNELLDKIKDYVTNNKNKSVLMSSHIGSDLKKICDRLYFIKDGKIIFEEKTKTLLDNYNVIDINSNIDDNRILFKMQKKDGTYSYIIEKNNNYEDKIRMFADIDDMIEIIMKGDLITKLNTTDKEGM